MFNNNDNVSRTLQQPLLGDFDVNVGVVDHTQVSVEEYGRSTTIKHSAFAATNHFIKTSRPFFPNRKLHKYIYCPNMRWFIGFLFLVNFLCPTSWYVCLGMDTFNAIFLIIFLQHQIVNCHSMRFVRKQPVMDGLHHWNTFYKLTVHQLQGVFLDRYQANSGAGFVQLNSGELRFQVFNKVALMYMDHARRYSLVYLLLVVLMAGWSGYWSSVRWEEWKWEDQFKIFRN